MNGGGLRRLQTWVLVATLVFGAGLRPCPTAAGTSGFAPKAGLVAWQIVRPLKRAVGEPELGFGTGANPSKHRLVPLRQSLPKQSALPERQPEIGYAGNANAPALGSGETALDSWTQGSKTILYLRVAFPDDPAEPISSVSAYALMGQVEQFYRENSYGSLEFATTVTPLLMLPQTKAVYGLLGDSQLQEDARQVARAGGLETDNYDLDIVRHNRVPGFNWNGKSWVGQKGIWMQTSSVGDTAHELGHNLGVKHANFWSATGDSVFGQGSVTDYGNPFDTMGSGNAGSQQFNAYYKWRMDWLPSSFVATATNSGTYRVYAMDSPTLVAGEHYALKIPKDFARDYWLEFRQRLTSNPWLMNGVLLNWNPWSAGSATSSGTTTLLDTSPGTPTGTSSREDAALVIGQTFSDPSAGAHFTPTAKGSDSLGNWIEVQVNLGSFPSNRPPTLAVAADQTNAAVNTPVAFNALASDPDGDALAYWWDFSDLTFGTNGATVSKSWAATGDYLVRCVVSDLRGGKASRSVAVKVSSPSVWAVTGGITNEFGQPVEGVRVHNGLSGATYRGSYTDSDGHYSLVNLAAGSFTLRAVKYGFTFTPSGWVNPVSVGPDAAHLDWQALALPIVTLSASDPVARESPPASNPDTGTFWLTRTGSLASPLTVRFTLTGTALYGPTADYVLHPPPTGSPKAITLPAGVAATNIVLIATNYNLAGAPPKSAAFTILEDGAYVKGTLASASVTLLDAQSPPLPVVNVTVSDDRALEAGGDPAALTFSRAGDLSTSLRVRYVGTGTAAHGGDYETLPEFLEFPAGVGSIELPVRPIDDVEPEPDETVTVSLVPAAGYDLGGSTSATVTILDDDPQRVMITATDSHARENSSDRGTFTVARSGSLAANLLVAYTLGGTTSNGTDYTFLSGSLLIPSGQATASVTVTPVNDSFVEGPETVVATLGDSSAYNVVNPGQATMTITDDDIPSLTLTASDASAAEPGTNTGTFTFTRTGSTTSPLTVYYDLYGTAFNGIDYTEVSPSAVIPAGTNSAELVITPLDDLIRETNETVMLVLRSNSTYALATTEPQTVTIADNDGSGSVGVSFRAASSSGPESQTGVALQVVLSAPIASSVTVDYRVTGGTAANGGVDFTLNSGTLSFDPGVTSQTVWIDITDDLAAEADETMVVNLRNPINAVLEGITNHSYTILDDDTFGNVTVTAVDPYAAEAGADTGTFRISRSGSTNAPLSVRYQMLGTASSHSDYLPHGNSVTLPAGQRFTDVVVTPVDDATDESDETVTLVLLSARGGRIGDPSSATVTMADNDNSDNLPILRVVADDPVAAEPGSDTGQFTISRDRGTNAPFAVAFTVGGTATSGADYNSLGTSVTIPAGAWSVPLSLVPSDDTTYEGNETVVLTLTIQGANRVSPQASAAAVTLMDNEAGVSVAASGATSEDGSSTGAFLISREGYLAANLTVHLALSGTASNGVDYSAIPSAVSIPAGTNRLRVEVLPLGDLCMEGTETVQVTLLPGTDYTVLSASNATVFLLDNAINTPPVITLHPASQIVTESSNATFAVTATGTPPLSYHWFGSDTNALVAGTNRLLVLPKVQDFNAGWYSVLVSNVAGAVLSSNAELVVNHRPMPASPRCEHYPDARLKIRSALLLGTDPDGDLLFLSSVSTVSLRSGAVSTNGLPGWIYYQPPVGLTHEDSFGYTVGDGRGGCSLGTVTLALVTNFAPALNLTWEAVDNGTVRLTGDGIPALDYFVEFAETLDGPAWQRLGSVVPDEFGGFTFEDNPMTNAPTRFYRLFRPAP